MRVGIRLMEQSVDSRIALRRLVAAYKLRLHERAERRGAREEIWDSNETISLQEARRLLAGEGKYRVSPYPFPGLRSFDPQEGENFFGRERNVADVQRRLVNARMVVVLGGSGTGKSSLLRAGLLPYLNTTRRIPGREGRWYMAEFRPRTDPLVELIDALVDQWLLPLIDLKRPALNERMGVQQGASRAQARPYLLNKMRDYFFDGPEPKPREQILAALLDVAGRQLDEYDSVASRGLRVPGPSLMLLLDQFEEVFRPEVPFKRRSLLLDLIVDLHRHLSRSVEKGGLFLAVTMRSEELHRCAEHRGLSEVINQSFYLLDLLDPREDADRSDLHLAIVQPARNVFEDWGLEYDRSSADAPFEKGMPEWLLEGAKRSSQEVEHRPDQLPLLQHALQAAWHGAMRRWSRSDFTADRVMIQRADLPGQKDGEVETPDLGACLRARADRAAERAAERFASTGESSSDAGERALKAAFRALARRDDRGTWARRFAEQEDMQAFMAADPTLEIARANGSLAWEALRQALHVFLRRGYLSGGDGRPYDISHEALIRNWPKFREWLREPEEVAHALNRVLAEVDPGRFRGANDSAKVQLIPSDVAGKIAALGPHGQLPEKWGQDQIAPALAKPAMQERWGGDTKQALQKVVSFAAAADELRRKAELASQQRDFEEKQRALELVQARALAIAHNKTAQRTRVGLITAICLLVVASGLLASSLWLGQKANENARQSAINLRQAEINARQAVLQGHFLEVSVIGATIKQIQSSADNWQAQVNQSERDIRNQRVKYARFGQNDNQNQVARNNEEKRKNAIDNREVLLKRISRLAEARDDTIKRINQENERHWNDDISSSERDDIVAKIVQFFSSLNSLNPLNSLNFPDFTNPPDFNAQSTLRMALYAVAAVPEDNQRLNAALAKAIVDYPQLKFFTPPAASQVWGLTFDSKSTYGLRAAVGDDNGVVWLWNPLGESVKDTSAGPNLKSYTAATGIVNGLAFSTEKNWLAAAYRDAGSAVWDLETGIPICVPGRPDDGSAAYSVAFNGTTLAVASNDRAVILWDVSKEGCRKRKALKASDVVYGVAFDPQGKRLAAASGDGTVIIWKLDAPGELHPDVFSTLDRSPAFAVAFSSDGKMIAATAADGRGYLWNIEPQNQAANPTVLPSRGGTLGQVAFSPDGQWLVATAKTDGTTIVTDARTHEERFLSGGGGQGRLGVKQRLFGVAFSRDSNYLLTGDLNGVVGVWPMARHEKLRGSRDNLIEVGRQRVSDMTLNDDECRTLRQMKIPIFDEAFKVTTGICPLPFLWGEAGGPG